MACEQFHRAKRKSTQSGDVGIDGKEERKIEKTTARNVVWILDGPSGDFPGGWEPPAGVGCREVEDWMGMSPRKRVQGVSFCHQHTRSLLPKGGLENGRKRGIQSLVKHCLASPATNAATMAQNAIAANLDSLSLSDTEADDTEDLFASPSVKSNKPHSKPAAQAATDTSHPPDPESEENALAAHEASLRRELASLRSMNQVITGITTSLEKAKSNMDTVASTVNNASTLLSTWTRILSQAEHNQRLILDPSWQGATQDIADADNQVVLKQQELERKEAEDARRMREREARREEEERRAAEPAKGTRGRGKGVPGSRGRASSSGYGVGGTNVGRGTTRGGSTTGRTGTGTGRGLGRGRSRGP